MTRNRLATTAVGVIVLLAAYVFNAVAAADEAVNLAKLDRAIAKEPAYRAASQEYCLIVFGPKAETRVWVVRDGATLYVDRNGNGDLSEPGESFAAINRENPSWDHIAEIRSRNGKAIYRDLEVRRLAQGYRVTIQLGPDHYQSAGAMQADKPKFAGKAKEAPIIHFDGPLALAHYSTPRVIPRDNTRSDRKRSLRLMVGTPGLGAGTFAAYDCMLCEKLGPLVANFEFPPVELVPRCPPSPRRMAPICTTESFAYDD